MREGPLRERKVSAAKFGIFLWCIVALLMSSHFIHGNHLHVKFYFRGEEEEEEEKKVLLQSFRFR